MNHATLPSNAPEWLRDLTRVIAAAFPSGFDDAMYFPLAKLLSDHCSYRSAARVLSWLSGKDASIAYHDVMTAISRPPDEIAVRRLRDLLEAHGFNDWVAANES